MSLHNPGPECQGCNKKLEQADHIMCEFFVWAKTIFPNLHISHSWRGEDEQNQYFESGKSKVKWPNSKHNYMLDGKPCSLALDLFLIDNEGQAHFDIKFYESLYNEIVKADLPIEWGGNFRHFKDSDHFQLKEATYATNR